MDLGYVVTWMVGALLFTLLVRSFQHPVFTGKSWRIIVPAIALAMFGTWYSHPELLAWVAGILYSLLVLLPNLGARVLEKRIQKGHYTSSLWLSRLMRLLHPADGLWDMPALIEILIAWSRGELRKADAIWRVLPADRLAKESFARNLTIQIAGGFGEWARVLEWVSPTQADHSADSWMDFYFPVVRMRALGELKRPQEQIECLERFLEERPPAVTCATALMFVSAFHGRTEAVKNLIGDYLQSLPPETRKFWEASSLWFEGKTFEARQLFNEVLRTCDSRTQRAVERRLAEEPAAPPDPQLQERVAELERSSESKVITELLPVTPYATNAIIVVLIAVFALEEFMGGSENSETLQTLGALYPEIFLNGEYWRLLTAGFLHYGAVHLAMNSLGLKLLGPLVERELGSVKYTMLYLGCIVASMTGVALGQLVGLITPQLMVGASGGVMGLVGWMGAHFFVEWRRHRTRATRQRVQAILLALAIQVAFDLSTANVSFAGHCGGLLVGAIAGLLTRKR